MPRYDDSPRGHSPMERGLRINDRRLRSPMMDRMGRGGHGRDSPPPPLPPLRSMSSRDQMQLSYRHDDSGYGSRPSSYHHSRSSMGGGQDKGGGGSGGGLYQILCVSNISNKYPDATVRNELVKEFSRYGDPSVKLVYDKNTRLAYIYFNNYDDAREARYNKSRLILLEKPIVLEPIYERMSSSSTSSRKRSLTPEYQLRGGGGSMRNLSPPPMSRRAPPPPPPPSRSLNHDRYQLVCFITLFAKT